MVDPGTAILIASAVASAAKGGSDFMGNRSQQLQAKRRAREAKRETQAGLMDEALNRDAELTAHNYSSKNKLGKSKARSSHDTAELVRGALNI